MRLLLYYVDCGIVNPVAQRVNATQIVHPDPTAITNPAQALTEE